jgi:hypothetical protein
MAVRVSRVYIPPKAGRLFTSYSKVASKLQARGKYINPFFSLSNPHIENHITLC